MPELKLHPGGRLVRSPWGVAEEDADKSDVEDVSEHAAQYLMEPVELHEGLRLFDLFALIRRDVALQYVYGRYSAKEYVDAAFRLESADKSASSNSADLEYLEIYSQWSRDSKTNVVDGPRWVHFHGVGHLLTEDYYSDGQRIGAAGTRITFGLLGRSVRELMGLPLRYNPDVTVTEACTDDTSKYDEKIDGFRVEYLQLGHIIYGVFRELSFNGDPQEAEEFFTQLNSLADEAIDALVGEDPPG